LKRQEGFVQIKRRRLKELTEEFILKPAKHYAAWYGTELAGFISLREPTKATIQEAGAT
jgi:hypothetical protein